MTEFQDTETFLRQTFTILNFVGLDWASAPSSGDIEGIRFLRSSACHRARAASIAVVDMRVSGVFGGRCVGGAHIP